MVDETTTYDVQTVKVRLRVLGIIHAALLGGVGLFTMVVLLLNKGKWQTGWDTGHPLPLMAMVGTAVLIVLALTMAQRSRSPRTLPEDSLETRLGRYQAGCIIRLALVEGGALFSAVAALVTRNAWALFPLSAAFVTMILLRPSLAGFLAGQKSR
jgi:hypothetical protein